MPDYPSLTADTRSWNYIESALTEYIKGIDSSVKTVKTHDPNDSNKVTDEELNVQLFADLERPDGTTEKGVEFELESSSGGLGNDELEFTRIKVLN